jgi:lipopolysaccharide export system ATP-binding protein
MSEFKGIGLKKSYGGRGIVNGVDINIHAGEIVGLLGPNGAGKTTTFYMMVGLVKADEGRITLGDEDLTELPLNVRARKGIGYLPQEASVFREMSVEENIYSVLELQNISTRKKKAKLAGLIEDFSLDHVKNSKGKSLSGGERRRVEIARTLALRPKFILLDEPFAGVDPIAAGDIQKIVKKLVEQGIGILITDHNVRETLGIVDRAYIMSQGNLMVHGTPEELANNEIAKAKYLGEDFSLG